MDLTVTLKQRNQIPSSMIIPGFDVGMNVERDRKEGMAIYFVANVCG